ncbi:Bug family tripartite tricarboxylate transporter substrate binding protein [Orrella marina]|uniref:Tripartite tricarboxylate transporter substrate binding protein n=1 Tax=Orrella marina TaxID=2163011 RepID=A0A2R4XFX4_9BURK|nr:tripartite tricarboxylate transporter substrate binding protein [Orrella marina]AWB32717.1 hypothetical protein DBV39_02185 [Orrella marina]
MNYKRKLLSYCGLTFCTIASLGVLGIAVANTQDNFPQRPITIIVGYAAGGPTDLAARTIAEQMSKELGQPIVVSNRPGASSLVAAKELMSSNPDGYTVLVTANAFFTHGPARYESVEYDYDKDFTPIGGVSGFPHILTVSPDSPIKSTADLIAYSKENPNKVNAARVGFANEIAIEWLNLTGNVDITQIPYKGAATVVSDLSSGRVDMALVAPSVAYPLVDGDKARTIATTRSTSITEARNIPSISETPGMEDFDMYIWYGLLAPAGLPTSVGKKLNTALNDSLKNPAVVQHLMNVYQEPMIMSPEEMTAAIHKERKIADDLVKEANLPLLKHQ